MVFIKKQFGANLEHVASSYIKRCEISVIGNTVLQGVCCQQLTITYIYKVFTITQCYMLQIGSKLLYYDCHKLLNQIKQC